MTQPPINGGARITSLAHAARLPAWPTLMAGVLIIHAALILGEQLDFPPWVAFVECVLASLVGLQRLREHTAAIEDPTLSATAESGAHAASSTAMASSVMNAGMGGESTSPAAGS